MSKIIVPQELQNKIIDLYVNKGYGRMKIKNELNLSYGDSVIKRVLKENNIHIRNFQEAKVGRYKEEADRTLQDEIIRQYKEGSSPKSIITSLSLPFSEDKVKSIIQDNNIHLRTIEETRLTKTEVELRKYPVDDNYVLESHNGAWLLGFIAADGYLPITKGAKNRIVISLAAQDKEILERIALELKYSGPIHQYQSAMEGFEFVSLAFASKKLRQQMEAYGIGNNKTFKLAHLPDLPKEYMIDFIRGFFDGDGSLFEPQGKKINISFTCASRIFLEELSDFLTNEYSLTKPTIHSTFRVHEIYDIRYYVHDSIKLCNLFYDNNYISLKRKKDLFLKIKEKYSLR